MKELLDAVAAMMVVFDDDSLIYTSPTLQTALGYTPATLYDLLDSADHAFINNREYRQQPQNHRLNYRKKDGTCLPVSLSVNPVNYEGKAAWMGTARDVTPLIQTEAEAKGIHEQYRIFLELLSSDTCVILVEKNRPSRLDAASKDTFARITGYTWEELDSLPGQEVERLLYPEDAELFESHINLIWQGKPANGIYRLRNRQGEQHWIYIRRLPVYNSHGQVVKDDSMMQDITERKQAEEAPRQSDERYRLTAELISDYAFAYHVEPDGGLVREWVTRELFQRITGYTPEEIDAQGSRSLYHPDDRERVRQDVEATLHGKPVNGEYRIVTRQGELRYIHLFRRSILDEQQRVVRYYGVAQDITERKLAEEALRQSEERYRVISELISDYAFSIQVEADGTQKIEWMTSDSFQRMTGYSLKDILGTLLLFHPDERERVRQDIQAVLRGESVQGEYRIVTHEGEERFIRLYRLPVWNESFQRVVRYYGVAQDTTVRRKMDEALRLQTELQILLQKEQDLSQLKNRLMGLITHEFRTPLAVISNSLGMLERHMDTMPPEKRRARVVQIYHQIDHLTEMLDDMSVVVRGEMSGISFKPARVEMVALCQEVVQVIGSTPGMEHQLRFSTRLEKLQLFADERLIQRILRNLLSNAIKYSAPGSVIDVTLAQKHNRLELSITDQGRGITPEELPHIFEPFYRSENVQTIPGLGLGLGIVKDAVEVHQGTIEVESTPGSGSSFTVSLPLLSSQQGRV